MSNIILINNTKIIHNMETLAKIKQKMLENYYKQQDLEIQELTLRLELTQLKQEEFRLEEQIAKEITNKSSK
jgi:hypothetical protein